MVDTHHNSPRLCFVGLENLPTLAREYNRSGVGGEQVQQTLLAKALARRGFDVSMIVADHGQPDGATWDNVKTYKAYRISAGLPVVRFIHPRWTGMWSAVRRANAAIYYTSCAGYQLGLLALFAKRHRPPPRILFRIAHDRDCDPAALLIEYWRDRKLYEYGLARADVILAQTVRQQEALAKNYHHDSVLAPLMLDRPARERDYNERDIAVLWVNNIRNFKRPDLALELARQAPSINIHMIGGAQRSFEQMYREIGEQALDIKNVCFHGPVPYHEVNEFYERARVFINTSDSEGFPNSYLQAWARGTPVVAFFDPDGLISREGLGYIASNLQDMKHAISALIENPARWLELSMRCRQYIAREYSEEKMLAPYLKAMASGAKSKLPLRPM